MLPELGQFVLILALLALAQTVLPLFGAWRNNAALIATAQPAAAGQGVLPGESTRIGADDFRFEDARHAQGPTVKADAGTIVVSRDGTTLVPQKRRYLRGQVQTESAIDPGFTRDIYVTLGDPANSDGAWSIRVYVKPFVHWIWLGALLMMPGGFIAAADRRFRNLALSRDAQPAPAPTPTAATIAAATTEAYA